ncbi:probable UDP-sugar transporter protein SLC35A4 [Amphiura filiformis]|uniref:probable UDP-sugar transporter protein SLC35A4 n=1 Tax=Amphiura filiformis TaxID=82378 RepID=UPI003B220F60
MDAPMDSEDEETTNLLPLFLMPHREKQHRKSRLKTYDSKKRGSLQKRHHPDVIETALERLASLLWPVLLITAVLVYGSHSVLINLSKRYGRIQYSSASVVFMIEVTKLVASVILWISQPINEWSLAGFRRHISLKKSLPFAVPAVLYALNNNIVVHIQMYMDPASFQMLSNLKIVSTAFLYRLIIKRRLTSVQWFAILLLIMAGASNSYGSLNPSNMYEESTVYVTTSGLILMTIYCTISGLAGVFTEYILKRHHKTPLSVQNFLLYSYGIPLNLLAYLVSSRASMEDADDEAQGLFEGYNTWTVIIIITQALNGLIMSAVMKHASNITRLFIISCAMVVTTLLSVELLELELNTYFCSAFALVFFALLLYNS